MLRPIVHAVTLTTLLGGFSACEDHDGQQPAHYVATNATTQATTSGSPVVANGSSLPQDACNAGRAAPFFGKHETAKLHEELQSVVGHDRIRWIHPGQVVTQDYRPDRLNIIVDEDRLIDSARCG